MSKKNTKLSKKIKVETLMKYSQLDEKLNTKLKICISAVKKRIEHLQKSMVAKDLRHKQAQDDLNQIKEVVLYYHKDLSEEHHGKEEVFRNVIQMPYSNTTNRVDILRKEIEKVKWTNETTKNIHSKRNEEKDWSQLTISPVLIKSETDCLSQLQSKITPGHYFDKAMISRSPLSCHNNSLNNSTMSFADPVKCGRFSEWHQLEQKTIVNKICNDCFKKESGTKESSKQLHKCKKCGIYLHYACRYSINCKICIPITKFTTKATGERSLDLKEFCQTQVSPMVPSVLLVLMHHIQTFGLQTADLYRATGRDKDVRDLCDKLFEGKPKILSRYDVQTSGNCLRFILRSLKSPLLPDYVVKKLLLFVATDAKSFENALVDCLNMMSIENRDTLVYLIIHLKIIADDERCRLDRVGLATVFMPSITSLEMCHLSNKQLIEMLSMILSVDYEFYNDCLKDNSCHQYFFKEKMNSSSFVN